MSLVVWLLNIGLFISLGIFSVVFIRCLLDFNYSWGRFLILFISGGLSITCLFGLHYSSPIFTDISGKTIEYKSISPQNGKYYAIGADGTIYQISQQTWAGLDAPVVAETK